MNTNRDMQRQQTLQDRLGLRIAARLAAGANALPHEVEERLRAAREQAASQRRLPAVAPARPLAESTDSVLGVDAGAALLGRFGGDPRDRLGRLATLALLVALAAGLYVVASTQTEDRLREVGRLDQALLTDDLPPQAYADPGFLQFLKTHRGGKGR